MSPCLIVLPETAASYLFKQPLRVIANQRQVRIKQLDQYGHFGKIVQAREGFRRVESDSPRSFEALVLPGRQRPLNPFQDAARLAEMRRRVPRMLNNGEMVIVIKALAIRV